MVEEEEEEEVEVVVEEERVKERKATLDQRCESRCVTCPFIPHLALVGISIITKIHPLCASLHPQSTLVHAESEHDLLSSMQRPSTRVYLESLNGLENP